MSVLSPEEQAVAEQAQASALKQAIVAKVAMDGMTNALHEYARGNAVAKREVGPFVEALHAALKARSGIVLPGQGGTV